MPPSAPSWKPDRRNPQHRRLIWIGQCAGQRLRRFQYRPECQPGNVRGGTEQRLQHQHPGASGFGSTHAWRQREYRPTGVRVFNAAAAPCIGWRQIQFDAVKTAAIVGNGQLTPGEYGRARSPATLSIGNASWWPAAASSPPPAASMPARKTSPCRSARGLSHGLSGRGFPDGAQSAFSFGSNCNSLPAGQGNSHDNHGRDRRPVGPAGTLRWPQPGRGPDRGAAWASVRDALNNPVVFGQAVGDGVSQPAGYVVSPRATSDHRPR